MHDDFFKDPLFGIAVTVGAYVAARRLHQSFHFLHPFVTTLVILLLILLPLHIPQEYYQQGGVYIKFLLGPATVALAVPLYKNSRHIRKVALPIFAAIVAGAITGIASAWALVSMCHGSMPVMQAMLPKSVTTPIAIAIVKQLHGGTDAQALVAAFTCVTGLLGALLGPRLLHAIGVRNHMAAGLAMGAAAHGIGTAVSIRRSELHGSAAGLAMALNGIVTSLLMIPIYPYFH